MDTQRCVYVHIHRLTQVPHGYLAIHTNLTRVPKLHSAEWSHNSSALRELALLG